MQKIKKAILVLSMLFILSASSYAADKIVCYNMWDDMYFYAAFEVPDTDIISTNTLHMSKPWEDDSIEVFLETDGKGAANRTSNTYQLSLSPGGGSNFIVGDDDGTTKEKKIFTFKFGKKVIGTLNRPSDKDTGYIIELAIPWSEMGGPPKPGQIMGYNAICRLRGEDSRFVSLSPEVINEEDINNPSKWTKIVFVDTPTIVTTQDGAYVCRKVRVKAPVIEGVISPNEWLKKFAQFIEKPEPPAQMPREAYMLENPVITHYFYWYQGNKHKEATYSHILNLDGSDALTTHPLEGYGFWMSSDSVKWHKEQLSAISNAGIDIIIPIYWGSSSDKKVFSSKGLSCMVQALKELKAERKSYPLVGMFFDTTAMITQCGENLDLTQDEIKQTFYGMIKDFFLTVPDEFLAAIQLPADRGGKAANIAVLYTSYYFNNLDGSFVDYCNEQYEKDFGRKLILIGSSDFRDKGATLDGYTNYGAGLGLTYDKNGWFSTAGVGVGFDNSAVPGGNMYRARYNGETYKKDWDSLIAVSPNWVFVDGWNEFHEGSDYAPSREYGDKYTGLTKINILRFNGMSSYDAKYLKHDIPDSIMPGYSTLINLVIKNVGTKPWNAGQGIYISGRWYKGGIFVSDTGARLPLQNSILAGQSFAKSVGIRAIDQEGNPLPEGDYELRIDMMHGDDEWFASGGDIPLCVPIKVSSQQASGFTLVSSTLPTLMKSGGKYNVNLSLRNDGTTIWKAGSKIAYRWYKSSVHLSNDSSDSVEPLGANESAAALAADVEPGRIVTIQVPVSVTVEDGSPLPVWKSEDIYTYLLKWDISDNGTWLASDKIGAASEAVIVTADDFGVHFVSNDTPEKMEGGKKYSVTVTVKNDGIDTWLKNDIKLGYHWCGINGKDIIWDSPLFNLPFDVKPGQTADIKASVAAPGNNGQYYLIWDMKKGDEWLSSSSNTRGGYIAMYPVDVYEGKLAALDLSGVYDEDVISIDTNPGDGSLDDTGMSLPGQFIPPYASPVRNAKLWACDGDSRNNDSLTEQISFAFPSKQNGLKNVAACNGQQISIKSNKYKAMHILALSAEDASGNISIQYKDRNVETPFKTIGWNTVPAGAAIPAIKTNYRYSADGIVRQPAYINRYIIPIDPTQDCTGIVLPNEKAIKILAITMEKVK